MAQESFDKEIQFLRMLVLTIGAYSRPQLAEKLGISVHNFDKTVRRLKEIAGTSFLDTLKQNGYDALTGNPLLLFLFRAKSLKDSERQRLALLLSAIGQHPASITELLDHCIATIDESLPLPDEKTIRNDVKYLLQIGVICKIDATRPHRYRLHNELFEQLDANERHELFDFISIMANTRIPSVHGYLLRDHLQKQWLNVPTTNEFADGTESPNPFESHDPLAFRYHFVSRILDEAHLGLLMEAIRQHQSVKFDYFTPKTGQRYTSKNTNPLFERQTTAKRETTLPLRIVYDHQYGRWYLIGYVRSHGIRKYRMEGMTALRVERTEDAALFAKWQETLDKQLRTSWLIDTGPSVMVRAKFFSPTYPEVKRNFVKDRVQLQGQWGSIVEENDDFFIYEIVVNGTQEIKPWLRSFGSSCEVLEPQTFREEMIAEWMEVRSMYESI